MKRLLFLLLLLVGWSAFAATTIYVGSPTTTPVGNDGNSGADAAHPKTLNGSLASLGPDVTLLCLDGTYVGPGGGRIQPTISGTAGHPWTIKAINKWKAIITGSSQEGFLPANGVSYYVIDGLCASNNPTDGFAQSFGHDFTYKNCWSITNSGNGFNFSGSDSNLLVDSCLAEWNGPFRGELPAAGGADHLHGVYLGHQGNTIRNSVFRHNTGYGIQVYDGYPADYVNSNKVYNCMTYSNNAFGLNSTYGITVYGAYGNNMSQNPGTNYVFGNTFLDGAKFRGGGIGFSNNIVLPVSWNPNNPVVYASPNAPVPFCDYNSSIYTLANAGAHDTVNADMGLANTNQGRAWLKSTSINRGTAANGVGGPVDFFSNNQTTVNDRGAFQYALTLENDVRNLEVITGSDYWALITPPTYYAGAPDSTPPGNDANDGLTAATPKTLPTCLAAMGPGITVFMLDGTYVGAGGGRIAPTISGTAASPTFLRAVNKWKAIVDHSSQEGIAFTGVVTNLVIDGLKIQYSASDGVASFAGVTNLVVKNLWVVSNQLNGVNFSQSGQSYNVIDSCMIEHNGLTPGNDGITVGGLGHVVRNSVMRYNSANGLSLFTSAAGNMPHLCQFYNNLTYGNGRGATIWNAVNDGSSPGTNYVYNNTFSDGLQISYGYCGITNNIILPAAAFPSNPIDYSIGVRTPLGVWQDYNLSTANWVSYGFPFFHEGTQDQTSSDLKLRNTANGLYWLTQQSPVFGAQSVFGPVDFFSTPQTIVNIVSPYPQGFYKFAYNVSGDVRNLVTTNFPNYWEIYVDPSAPVISGVTVSVAQTTAGVAWTTDEPSDQTLEWGTTVAYGNSATSPNLLVVHNRTATGLTGGTTYHFRVKSTDNAGNTSVSNDGTFTTTPPPVSPPGVQFHGNVNFQGNANFN